MRVRGSGYWELFIPRARPGDHYKFDIIGQRGQHLPMKSDPLAFAAEVRPKTASIVVDPGKLPRPRPAPSGINSRSAPISIYEVHLGSWRRKEGNRWLTYRELAEQLPGYVRDMGLPMSNSSPSASIPLTAPGAISRRDFLRRPAALALRKISSRWSMPVTARGLACCSTGCPAISPTTRTGSAISTALRSMSTPIPARAGISTGAR
jgi:hypothetical protein